MSIRRVEDSDSNDYDTSTISTVSILVETFTRSTDVWRFFHPLLRRHQSIDCTADKELSKRVKYLTLTEGTGKRES